MKALMVAVNQEKFPYPVMPIGAAAVCAALERDGHRVKLLDLMFCTDVETALRKAIRGFSPQVILISIRNTDNQILMAPVSHVPDIRRVVDMARFLSDAQIVVGGTGFTSYPQALYEILQPDYGIVGEGEISVSRLLNEDPPEDIPGLVHVDDRGRLRINAMSPPASPELSQSHALAFIDARKYLAKGSYMGVQTRRGCPRHCIYCSDGMISGKKVRTMSPAQVVEDIRRIKECYGIRHFFFVDELFSEPLGYAKRLLQALIDSGIRIRFEIEDAPPNYDDEYITLLKKAGCLGVCLTVDSGCDAMLRSTRKGFGRQDVIDTCNLLHRHQLPYYIISLLGNPGETLDTVKETFALYKSLPGVSAVIVNCGLRICAGAEIAAMARQQSLIDPDDDLLDPKFFLARGFDEAVLRHVLSECRQNPGWMTMSRIDQFIIRNLFDRFKAVVPRPEWQHARVISRLMKPMRRPLSYFIDEWGFEEIVSQSDVVFG